MSVHTHCTVFILACCNKHQWLIFMPTVTALQGQIGGEFLVLPDKGCEGVRHAVAPVISQSVQHTHVFWLVPTSLHVVCIRDRHAPPGTPCFCTAKGTVRFREGLVLAQSLVLA
jgi:hypothetical protein